MPFAASPGPQGEETKDFCPVPACTTSLQSPVKPPREGVARQNEVPSHVLERMHHILSEEPLCSTGSSWGGVIVSL